MTNLEKILFLIILTGSLVLYWTVREIIWIKRHTIFYEIAEDRK